MNSKPYYKAKNNEHTISYTYNIYIYIPIHDDSSNIQNFAFYIVLVDIK